MSMPSLVPSHFLGLPRCSYKLGALLSLCCLLSHNCTFFGHLAMETRRRKRGSTFAGSLGPHPSLAEEATLPESHFLAPRPRAAGPAKEPPSHSSHPGVSSHQALSPSVPASGFLGASIPSQKIQKEKQKFKLNTNSVGLSVPAFFFKSLAMVYFIESSNS